MNYMLHEFAADGRDSIDVLPLSVIPLKTRSLQDARLIKNTRLEGVVELFNDSSAGSGQIPPSELGMVFDLSGERSSDLDIVTTLSGLPSYDVFSLRLSLRDLGISVEDDDNLKLSEEKTEQLAKYMSVFTRPLIANIYDDGQTNITTFEGLLRLFAAPEVSAARENLIRLADALEIAPIDIANFLETYADIYLSLSFYQQCFEQTEPSVTLIIEELKRLQQNSRLAKDKSFTGPCAVVEQKLSQLASEISSVLTMFQSKTKDMWEDISAEQFRVMARMVSDHQESMGGALCAMMVKTKAWNLKFGRSGDGNIGEKVDFIIRDMLHGLETVNGVDA